MRDISAELAAAAKSLNATPAVFLAVEDRPPMAERVADLVPCNLNGGDANAAALCGPLADGKFLRVYADGDGAVWSVRSDLLGLNDPAVNLAGNGAVNVDADMGMCVAVCGSGDIARAFWIDAGRQRVVNRTTVDGGRNWGPAVDVPVNVGTKRGIAASWSTSGEVLFYDYVPDGSDHHLCALRFNGGWGASVDSGLTLWSVEHGGLAADHDPTDLANSFVYVLAIDGGNGNSRLRGLRYSSARQAWDGAAVLLETEPLSGFDLRWPTLLARGRGDNALHLLAWMENFTGNPAYSRTVYAWTPDIFHCPPPTPWQYQTHGLRAGCLARDDAHDYLAAGTYGYAWPRWTASATQRWADLGTLVTKVDLKQHEDRPGSLVVHLNDDGGLLADAGKAGTDGQMLRPGSTLNLGLGYVTANGPEYGYQQGWTITGVDRRRMRRPRGATSELVLTCADALGWLDKVTPYFDQVAANVTNASLLQGCLDLISLSNFVEANADTQRQKALVSLATGTPYRQLFTRLLYECGLICAWHATQSATAMANQWGLSLYGYAYWSATHHHIGGEGAIPVLEAVDGAILDEYTHAEVFGGRSNPADPASVTFGEAWDLAALRRHERPLALKWHDTNLVSNDACKAVADNLVLRHEYHRQRTEVITPYQPAVELGDIAQLTDEFLGLVEATRYVRGLETHYDANKGIYISNLLLEASIG